MRLRVQLVLPFAALVLFGCSHPAAAPPPAAAMSPGVLRSPWDTTPIQSSDIPYDCGPAPAAGPDITVTDSLEEDGKHLSGDVKAAVYAQSSTALDDLMSRVVRAADFHRGTGSAAAAQCVVHLLSAAASSGAMTGYMASADAWKVQVRALRAFLIAFLKVRGEVAAPPDEIDTILHWMDSLVRVERTHYEREHCGTDQCDLKGHMGLAVAFNAVAVGVATQNGSLFHWGVSQYHTAVGDIDGRGMLHYDLRGRYALKFNTESAAALVQIAEFGEVNGQPLYAGHNGAIHLLVHTVAIGIVSPETYKSATRTAQLTPKGVEPWQIAWASVYSRRFPDPVVASLLAQIGPSGVDMWGGEPWEPQGKSGSGPTAFAPIAPPPPPPPQ